MNPVVDPEVAVMPVVCEVQHLLLLFLLLAIVLLTYSLQPQSFLVWMAACLSLPRLRFLLWVPAVVVTALPGHGLALLEQDFWVSDVAVMLSVL